MNAYDILQVSHNASAEVIRAAWAALIRDCHPDGPKPDVARTRTLNEAYAVLKDSQTRKQLDDHISFMRQSQSAPQFARQDSNQAPNYPPAYPTPYMGFTEDEINGAIQEMTDKMPPILKFAVAMAHQAKRRS